MKMKNFIFKSNSKSDLYKIFTQLDMLLKEQRAQRIDLAWVKNNITLLLGTNRSTTEEEIGASDSQLGE